MDNNYYPQPQPSNGLAIASLVCGIVGLLFNPLYLVSIAAIVMGAIAISTGRYASKGLAIAGLALGAFSLVSQCVFDLIITFCTFGLGFFTIFF